MGRRAVMRHQPACDLAGEGHLHATIRVDLRQLFELGLRRFRKGLTFGLEIGAFGVGLRADRDLFARRNPSARK